MRYQELRKHTWMLWREARYGDAIDPGYRKWAVGRTVEWTLEAHIADDRAIDELGLHLLHDFHDQFDSTERLRFAAWWDRVMDHGFDGDNPMKHLHPAKRETAPA